ncbi:DUF3861 domain-containing protein [Vibrio agarivorans]|uniref:DUF3861 domain-containing protein n=1 Tax=Vibrio agarivorans TaxID=153622 RepID=A0ABT7XZT8_9VIBR|nr:DUF3861 domain-containing protein [Vibrio agarivorans]MDN2481301.1 DUF3861 domain-containing protein [Vibrio agarivorans]
MKTYTITIEEQNIDTPKTLTFEMQDREDLLAIVETLNAKSGLAENEATRLAVALRLMGPVMMKDRKHPLFANFFPHFKDFMTNLKKTVKSK